MDKYLLIILMFMIAGMIIAVTRAPFIPGLFYAMLGGAIIIIIYGSMKNRREHKEKRRENRRSKK
jgi:4-hydroxybenzoate polyprenyltransferase